VLSAGPRVDRRVLKGRNRIGAYSLIAALVGFLFIAFQPWVPLDRLILFRGLTLKGLLASFFSASLVGALADWFAVSALFTNPLGIPLPHTNILARHKDVIADAVPRFLGSFVSEEKIALEMAGIDFAARARELLGREALRSEIRDFLKSRISSLLSGYGALDAAKVEGISIVLRELFVFLEEKLDASSSFAGMVRWARREALDERIVESAASMLRGGIERNRSRIAAAITPLIKQNAGWQGIFVGQATVERLLHGMGEELERIRNNRSHDVRRALAASLDSYAARLAGEVPDRGGDRERFRGVVRGTLRDESFRTACASLFAGLLGRLGVDLSRPQSGVLEAVERAENALQTRLGSDGEFQRRFNRGVASLLSGLIARSRLVDALAEYLSEIMKRADERDFVRRVEAAVWNDLQYIRVNGSVVGGLVGLALSLINAILPK
jgi:uncharacterized membrane-anchored protein YjiN (DUF445 family)